jgi:hypothetical protein
LSSIPGFPPELFRASRLAHPFDNMNITQYFQDSKDVLNAARKFARGAGIGGFQKKSVHERASRA